VTVHRGDRHWAARGSHDVPPLNFRYDSHPPGKVRRAIDRPGWVPFVLGTGGDYLAVDMDPGPNGRPGQVIRIGGDSDDGPVYVADSVTTLFRSNWSAG
jgi:cell wall assembly regulator SMI1